MSVPHAHIAHMVRFFLRRPGRAAHSDLSVGVLLLLYAESLRAPPLRSPVVKVIVLTSVTVMYACHVGLANGYSLVTAY